MKLHASIADQPHDIQIQDDGARVFAEIDGRSYELDVHEFGPGKYLIVSDSQVLDCQVQESPGSGKPVSVQVGTAQFAVTVTDPKRLSRTSAAGAHGPGAAQVIAPMPGKVVRVMTEAGAQVDAGSGIAIVEAMKMQNELKSPKAGTVVTLNAREGETVNAGDVLAVIE